MYKFAKENETETNFGFAILSDNDKIFIPAHQQEYYKGKYKILKNSAHNVFLFSKF